MGAGLAKQFAARWPQLKSMHADLVRSGQLRIDRVALVNFGSIFPVVVLFPTKLDWRDPSEYKYLSDNLNSFRTRLERMEDHLTRRLGAPLHIAMPALGCGLGGLDWDVVNPMIENWTHTLPSYVNLVEVYVPWEIDE
jgi:hypothetical protein